MNYDQALNQLNQIVDQLEHNNVSLEQLADRLKEARRLLQYCKDRLKTIEKDVDSLFEEKTAE